MLTALRSAHQLVTVSMNARNSALLISERVLTAGNPVRSLARVIADRVLTPINGVSTIKASESWPTIHVESADRSCARNIV